MVYDDRINLKMFFLKILRLSDFRVFFSTLFHSITVGGKKGIFKKIMSHFKRRNIYRNIEKVCRRLLVQDLIKIIKFFITSSFFERF